MWSLIAGTQSNGPNWLQAAALVFPTLVSIATILGFLRKWLDRKTNQIVDARLRELGLLPKQERP